MVKQSVINNKIKNICSNFKFVEITSLGSIITFKVLYTLVLGVPIRSGL